jgi:opacity protein-like surface antigen
MTLNQSMGVNLTKFSVILALNLVSQAVLAGAQGNVGETPTTHYQPVITVTVGPDFMNAGHAQTLTLLPPFQNHYTSNNASQTVVDVGGFVGVERAISHRISAQLGVSGYYDSNINPQGHVWQFALPEFDNLKYKYRIQMARAMVSGKILTSFADYASLHPYVSWEVGAAFNRASNYAEKALIPTVIPPAPFASHSQTSFAYGVGVGLDYNLNEQIRVGLGYQFADLGAASLRGCPDALTNQTLRISHLYTNQLRFQLTYLV